MANPNWVKGRSGNPKGRPPKNRALTALLEEVGTQPLSDDGVPPNRIVAAAMWRMAATGKAKLPGGRIMKLAEREWLDLVSKIFSQIDGPPKQEIGMDADVRQFVLGMTPEQFKNL